MNGLRLGRKVALPPAIRAGLERIFGDAGAAIAQVAIIEHSLFARLHLAAVATTRRRRIFLSGSAEDFFGDPALMLHEYCHVLLQWEPGALTTPRYLRECLRHGYWNNPYEVEARTFAQRHLSRLRQLLSSGNEAGAP
ncbi:MAG TPA: hypothetical protein VMU67_08550 [Steroidobacteraceae bacterium]|nr:hypothetical protein [Steroidobacteraceae bacterium]